MAKQTFMSCMPKGLLECGNIDSQGAGLRDCRAQAGKEELAALLGHRKPNTCSFVPGLTQVMAVAVTVAAVGAGAGACAMGCWFCFSCKWQRGPGALCQVFRVGPS